MRVIIKKGNSADPEGLVRETSFRVAFETKPTSLVFEEEIKPPDLPVYGAGQGGTKW
jgi:hypothetical protein